MKNLFERLHLSPDEEKVFEQERVLLEVTERICDLLDAQGLTRTELAQRLGVSPAAVTKLLRHAHNFQLRTLSDVFTALGRSLHVYDAPLGDALRVPGDGHVVEPERSTWKRHLTLVAEAAAGASDTDDPDGRVEFDLASGIRS